MLIGLIGKASCGKSTFFKATTLADVAIASYPFTTIAPNRGVGFVKVDCVDKEFKVQCNPRVGFCKEHKRFVPVDLIDVAGLVPGAHKGKGLGLQFLNDLNQADALIHIVDISGTTNEKGEAAENYDPAEDIKFLEEELDYWYLDSLKKTWEKFSRTTTMAQEQIDKALLKQFNGLGANEDIIKDSLKKLELKNKKLTDWSEKDLFNFARELRVKTKPMLVAANKIDLPESKKNYERIKKEFSHIMIIPCSADSELALREADNKGLVDYVPGEKDFKFKGELNEKQKNALNFIKESVLDKFGSTGVQNALDKAVFELLNYIAIFPGGVNKLEDQYGRTLPDCFLLPKNSSALDFAFKIHTDLGKNFIKAIDVKTKRIVGKEHLLKNRDVIEIITKK